MLVVLYIGYIIKKNVKEVQRIYKIIFILYLKLLLLFVNYSELTKGYIAFNIVI